MVPDIMAPPLGWAALLARHLDIVTEDDERGGDVPELERYVRSVEARSRGCGVTVGTRVVRDAIDVRAGLIPVLDRTSALVVLGSFVYPVVVEPLFNSFRTLPDGPLRRLASLFAGGESDLLTEMPGDSWAALASRAVCGQGGGRRKTVGVTSAGR